METKKRKATFLLHFFFFLVFYKIKEKRKVVVCISMASITRTKQIKTYQQKKTEA